jgi:hypothetical protein
MRRQIYIPIFGIFGGMTFASIFLTHSSTWQISIIPFLIGLFGLIFDRK